MDPNDQSEQNSFDALMSGATSDSSPNSSVSFGGDSANTIKTDAPAAFDDSSLTEENAFASSASPDNFGSVAACPKPTEDWNPASNSNDPEPPDVRVQGELVTNTGDPEETLLDEPGSLHRDTTLNPSIVRKIIHIDMDAFFASVEQRDNPELRGVPTVVGGNPNSRSVVAAASYEARKFGIHSAMPCSQAYRLCPHAKFVRPRFDAYKAASLEIMEIFREYTDLVEPLSLDEAFLDVTENKFNIPSATWIAQEIRGKIFAKTKLTASAGVAPNKFLAKIASDLNKPNGITVIPPDRVQDILHALPVRKIPGVGRVTEEKLVELKILTTFDLRKKSENELIGSFGKMGSHLFRIARGIDHRAVTPHRERKSIGVEDTFSTDIESLEILFEELEKIAREAWRRLRENRGRTITVKVTYAGFEKVTRGRTLSDPVKSETELLSVASQLLQLTEAGKRPIRLLGVSISNFDDQNKGASTDPNPTLVEPSEVLGPFQLDLPFPHLA